MTPCVKGGGRKKRIVEKIIRGGEGGWVKVFSSIGGYRQDKAHGCKTEK